MNTETNQARTEKVRVRQSSRARPQAPAVRTVSSVSSPQPEDFIVAEGPNTQQLSAGQGESGESLVAKIEKIKQFLATANNVAEKTETADIDGVYWADIALIDQNDNEDRTPASSGTLERNKRKSWMR